MVLNEKKLKLLTKILAAVFIAVFSVCVCAKFAPETAVVDRSVESLDEAKDTVIKLSAATLALSVGITLLPDDWATPLADSLAEMGKYFVMILGVVYFEKLLVLEGIPFVFTFMVPAVCTLYVLYFILSWKTLASLANKILVLGVAVVLAVPCSTFVSNRVCAEGLSYVNDTISLVKDESSKVEELSTESENNDSFFEKVSNAFQTAISGVQDLFGHFKVIIEKCIYSIAILMIAYCVIPVLTFLLLLWMVKQFVQIQGMQSALDALNPDQIRLWKPRDNEVKEGGKTE